MKKSGFRWLQPIACTLCANLIIFTFCRVTAAEVNTDTLRIFSWQAPTLLNPHISGAFRDWMVSRITYEPLASFDANGELIPFLAAEIPSRANNGVASDGKSVTWKLKKDIKWSDGHPFTAHDVLFTYEYITNPETKADSKFNYNLVERVEVIDDWTVTIHFKQATPSWSTPFVGRNIILPRHIFAQYNNKDAATAPPNMKPVGTGPYRFVKYGAEEMLLIGEDIVEVVKIIFEPNPFYRNRAALHFSKVEIWGGGGIKMAARSVLKDGKGDFADNLQMEPKELMKLKANGTGNILSVLGPMVERIYLNFSDPNRENKAGLRSSIEFPHPFFNDHKVCQAFAHAMDRESIAALYGMIGRATTNCLVSPAIYRSPNTGGLYNFDLDRAAELLNEAGWIDTDGDGTRDKNGIKMKVLFQSSVNSLRQHTQKIVQQALESIGVEVELKYIEASVFFKHDPANTNSVWHFYADMEMFNTGNRDPDPYNYLGTQTCSDPARPKDSWKGPNMGRWCNADYDALHARAGRELDPEKRRRLFIQLNDMLIEKVVIIPLVNRAIVHGISNTLTGIELTPWDQATWKIYDWQRKRE